jgi:hypothetical protein
MKMISAACGLQHHCTQHYIPANTNFQDDPNANINEIITIIYILA